MRREGMYGKFMQISHFIGIPGNQYYSGISQICTGDTAVVLLHEYAPG